MKKLIILMLAMVCLFAMTACNTGNQEQVLTYSYSFSGENECFSISNGAISLGDTEEVFEGDNLEVVQSSLFADVVSFSTTFYTMRDGEKCIILSNHVVDQTGDSVYVNGSLGSISGADVISGTVENIDDLKENLWFELKTTKLDGTENVYQLQLTLSE